MNEIDIITVYAGFPDGPIPSKLRWTRSLDSARAAATGRRGGLVVTGKTPAGNIKKVSPFKLGKHELVLRTPPDDIALHAVMVPVEEID